MGAAMISSIGIRAATFLLVLSTAAAGQSLVSNSALKIVPNTIVSIPPLARAVMSGDREQIAKLLGEAKNLDEPVRAKEGVRAGFTPLILAAALSEPDIAQLLVKRGAKITVLDDFDRSALWYAAVDQDVGVTQALIFAHGAGEVVNTPDKDLQRTPLQIAVRSDSPQVALLLYKIGASPKQKDILGETVLDYCKREFNAACKVLPPS